MCADIHRVCTTRKLANDHREARRGPSGFSSRAMRTLKTSEAAALLNVSANTLRTWERRFDYPKPHRSPGRHRLYIYAEIVALRAALEEGLSISSAISVASETLDADGHAVVTALTAFRTDEADLAMEMSLGLRSVERTVEDVLLPALAEIRRRKGPTSAVRAYASRWATDWLSRARRLTPIQADAPGMLIGSTTETALDPSGPYIFALQLCCARAGIRAEMLPTCACDRLSEAIGVLDPAVIVIAGGQASDDAVARWAYAARQVAGDVPFLLYHRGEDTESRGGARALSPSPVQAERSISRLLFDIRNGSTPRQPRLDPALVVTPSNGRAASG
jgi:MerR family transcriptional regulator, light-induced transcriptional regulator